MENEKFNFGQFPRLFLDKWHWGINKVFGLLALHAGPNTSCYVLTIQELKEFHESIGKALASYQSLYGSIEPIDHNIQSPFVSQPSQNPKPQPPYPPNQNRKKPKGNIGL